MKNLLITLGYHTFYTIFIILFLGYVDTSYSDTFYKLEGLQKLLFWGWLFFISIPSAYYLRNKSRAATIGAFGIMLVFICSDTVGEPIMSDIHVIGATGAIILMLFGFATSPKFANWRNWIKPKEWNIFNYSVIFMLIGSFIILPVGPKSGIKNHTFYIEMFMIYVPTITLIIHELKQRNEKTA